MNIYIYIYIYINVYIKIHTFSFDRSWEILHCHSSISAEMSTSVTLTWCTNTLKLIRMLKYPNNTYNSSNWQQQTLEKKSLEKINQRKKRWSSAVRRKRIMPANCKTSFHRKDVFLTRQTNQGFKYWHALNRIFLASLRITADL